MNVENYFKDHHRFVLNQQNPVTKIYCRFMEIFINLRRCHPVINNNKKRKKKQETRNNVN